MQRHRFRKPSFCLWRGENVHTKTREYRTARRICVARVPEWILTTCHSLSSDGFRGLHFFFFFFFVSP